MIISIIIVSVIFVTLVMVACIMINKDNSDSENHCTGSTHKDIYNKEKNNKY